MSIDPVNGKPSAVRQEFIAELILKGWATGRAIRALMDEFGIEERQAYRDLANVRKELASHWQQADIESRFAIALERTERLLQTCLEDGPESRSAALGALRHISELQGLTATMQSARLRAQTERDLAAQSDSLRAKLAAATDEELREMAAGVQCPAKK